MIKEDNRPEREREREREAGETEVQSLASSTRGGALNA
jgi:hypothetical protein